MKKFVMLSLVTFFAFECSGQGKLTVSGSSQPLSGSADPKGIETMVTVDAGGTVVYNKSEVVLQVPANSVGQDVAIGIEKINQIPTGESDGFQAFNQAYKFSPAGTQFSLSSPAVLTMKYDGAALLARNLDPASLQIFYFDPQLGRYVNVASQVDIATGKVTAQVEHFTVYLPLAKTAVSGNIPPVATMQAPIPAVIRAGAPIYMRATATDYHVNGAIAGVQLFYRKLQPVPGAWQQTNMGPETDNTGAVASVGRYVYTIPSTFLTAGDLGAGNDFEYYVQSTDNFGVVSTSATTSVNVANSYVAGTLTVTPATLNIASGFQRLFTFQGTDTAAAVFTLIPESANAGAIGQILNLNSNGALFKATTSVPGTVQGSFGAQVGSAAVSVFQGSLDRIAILDENGQPIIGTIQIKEGHLREFDAVGYDAFGNTILIVPNWMATPSIGAVQLGGLTQGTFLNTLDGIGFGTLQAGLGSVTATQWIQILARSWFFKGGVLSETVNEFDSISEPSMAVSGQTPYIAWSEYNDVTHLLQIRVKHWSGTAWIQDGGNAGGSTSALRPRISMSNTGTPHIVYANGNEINVRYWNGYEWLQLGGNLKIGPYASSDYSIAFAGATPYVAWQESNGIAYQVYVKYWNGSSWIQNGGSLNLNVAENAQYPSIDIAGTIPYVSFQETAGGIGQVYVKHWNGASWVQDGSTINVNAANNAYFPDLKVWASTPYVTWVEFNGTANQVYTKFFDTTTWVQLGTSLNVNTSSSGGYPKLAFSSIAPYVTWEEGGKVYVKHWRGSAWFQDGANLNSTGVFGFTPAISVSNNTPYVTWIEGNASTFLYAKALE